MIDGELLAAVAFEAVDVSFQAEVGHLPIQLESEDVKVMI
jgi:hypothetical protein